MRSCCEEMMVKGLVDPSEMRALPITAEKSAEDAVKMIANYELYLKKMNDTFENKESYLQRVVAYPMEPADLLLIAVFMSEGSTGRGLRKQPIQAYSVFSHRESITLREYLSAVLLSMQFTGTGLK